jgi:hypothetical protein
LRAFTTKPTKPEDVPKKEKKEGIPERKKPGRPKKEKLPTHDPIPTKLEVEKDTT